MSDRVVHRGVAVEYVVFDDRTAGLSVTVHREGLEAVLLELSLLRFELSPGLALSTVGHVCRLVLDESEFGDYRREGSLHRVGLHRRQIEAIMVYLLTYYRDGVAAVRHVDVDVGTETSEASAPLMLTILVDEAQALMSAEEARRAIESM
jgi:hypothetical protein